MSLYPIKIFSGSAHPSLAQDMCDILGLEPGKATTVHLHDSEVYVTIPVPPPKRSAKIEIISIVPLLAGIIADIHTGRSISLKLVLS